MADLEQKLRHYYENDPDYRPSEDFAARLKALEARPAAAPKRRRRYLLPAAAALALALGVSGWALLRSPAPSQVPETVQAPAPVTEDTDDRAELSKPPAPEVNKAPAPKEQIPSPAESAQKEPAQSAAEFSAAPAGSPPTIPEAAPPALPNIPAEPEAEPDVGPEEPAKPEEPVKPEEPAKPDEPAKPEEPAKPDEPVKTDEPANEQPETPVKPEDPPEEAPHGDDPTPTGDPQVIRLEEHDIDASYLMEDGRETLALKCLSTGASVELDVTGWQEELSEPPALPPEGPPPEELPTEETPAQAAAATYTGRSSIVDVIFDKNIVFYLILEEDGTVRVKLDVTEA